MCVCVRVCVWQEDGAEKEEDTLRDRKIVCVFFGYMLNTLIESLYGEQIQVTNHYEEEPKI